MQNLEIIMQTISIILTVLSLIVTLGIIWRAEMRLDTVYKVFFCALIVVFLSKIMEIFVKDESLTLLYYSLRLLSASLLFWSVWLLRDLIQRLDGEKK